MENPYQPFTPESVQRMLSFLPAFERGDFRGALDSYMKSGQNPPQVDELISAVYRSGFVLQFDWMQWSSRIALQTVDSADILTLRKLMTCFVRGDRFCGGAMPKRCADGSIQRVLERLHIIASANSEEPPTDIR